MDGNIQNLLNFVRGQSRIIIPVYQRNYDWTHENCKRLFHDLLTVHKENRRTHFFGSIVVKPGNLIGETIVIDGQQRITSISLFILAISEWMKQNEGQGERITPTNLKSAYLEDDFSSDVNKQKLQLNPFDNEAYQKLYGDEKFYEKVSNITINFKYFYEKLSSLEISLDELMHSIEKLQVMVVNLNSPEDDPQLIFESLNSTGLELTDADKIRNFLLMNETQEKQAFYFDHYWSSLEQRTDYQLTLFFWYFLAVKLSNYPIRSKTYETFKTYFSSNHKDKEQFFEEISDYSHAFKQIINAESDSKLIDGILYRFNQINVTVVRPFFMSVLYDYNKKKFTEEQVYEILSSIESYIARRIITQYPSNALNKIMAKLYRDFNRLYEKELNLQNDTQPVDILNYLLLRKENTGAFPTDEELLNSLKTRDFYKINNRHRTYVFERFENNEHNELLDVYGLIESGKYSIEHIMPQKLTPSWIKELGSNYKDIHEKYLNQLGNLTITGYNSKYSNKPFQEKKTMEKGFSDSHFVNLNKIPKYSSVWTETEIDERASQLAKSALEIWKYSETCFKEEKLVSDLIVYDGNESFSHYAIKGYILLDRGYKLVTTWKELLLSIMTDLAEMDFNKLYNLTTLKKARGWETNFSTTKNHKNEKVIEGIYVKTSSNNWNKMNIVRNVFDIYGIDYSELQLDARLSK